MLCTFRRLTAKGHLSTAHDMSIMGRRLFYDFPQYYNIFSRRSTDAGLATVNNTNRRFLDAYKGADGIKTGYTDAAGFNLTASAERNSVRIIATVFGGTSTADRNAKMAKLLDLGFAKAPANAQTNVPTAPILDGADDELLVSQVDESLPEVEGGAGKTLRVTMNPTTSPRPIARPNLEDAGAAAVVVASLDAGIDAALTEAATPPAEPGTLEFQAAALADGAEPSVISEPGTLEYQAAALAQTPVLDAPDLVSADNAALVDTAGIAAALAEAGVEVVLAVAPQSLTISAAASTQPVQLVAAPRPPKRNKPIYDNSAAQVAVVTETAPQSDLAAGEIIDDSLALDVAVTEADIVPEETIELAAAEIAPEVAAPPQPEVVTRISSSGGRQFGIFVGRYGSSYEAERALLQVQLRESTTLALGLRKVVQKKGGFEANFMGLTEAEASLACRKLTARQVECQTIGS